MTDREKLTKLIRGTPDVKVWPDAGGKLADHLTVNGVTFAKDNNVLTWIPVTERLPGNDVDVLMATTTGGCFVGHFNSRGWRVWDDEYSVFRGLYGSVGKVTHWMPLPEPPKGD